MGDSILAWIGTAVAIIVGWDKIIIFIQALGGIFGGFMEFLRSLPPVMLLALLIGIFWWMAND